MLNRNASVFGFIVRVIPRQVPGRVFFVSVVVSSFGILLLGIKRKILWTLTKPVLLAGELLLLVLN